ncbi:hypothetical protein Tco_1062017 [Tanacetum coccineum]
MKTRLARKTSMKKKLMQKEFVSKQGRKPAKSEPTLHEDPAFNDLDDILNDGMDYTEDAHDKGRTVVLGEKESAEKGVSTEDPVSTAQPKVSTDKPKVSTDKPKVSTDKPKVSTDKDDEGNADPNDGNSYKSATPTTVFKDDETIAQFLVTMNQNKAKQKGDEIKDTEETDRLRTKTERSVLTLKSLPKIDPKDKGKKVLEEEAESEGVNETERKFAQLESDAEIARKLNEDMQAELERERIKQEEATKAALIRDYDDIKARIDADRILAARLQEEERESFTVEQRAKFLHDTIAA